MPSYFIAGTYESSCRLSVYIFYHCSVIAFFRSVYTGEDYVLTFSYILL